MAEVLNIDGTERVAPESISAEDRQEWQRITNLEQALKQRVEDLNKEVEYAGALRKYMSKYTMSQYKLGSKDSIDIKTGVVTRDTAKAAEAQPTKPE